MGRLRLTKRADGRYRCVYKGKYFYGATQQEALKKRDDYKAAVKRGMNPSNITVEIFAGNWIQNAKPDVSPKTYNDCLIHLEKMMSIIGDKRIIDVKASDIKKVYSTGYSGLSDSYIRHAKNLFVSMFDAAVADGIILSNPARQTKPHKGSTGSHRAITEEERSWIENCAQTHRAFPIVALMLYAGLRPSEATAMMAENLDFDNEKILVRTFRVSAGTNKRTVVEKGKTKKAVRSIPMLSRLKEVLLPFKGKTGLLITGKNGEVLSAQGWDRAWESYVFTVEKEINGISRRWYGKTKGQKKLLAEGKLKPWVSFDVVPYDLRHSFVTWCRDNGVELHTVMEWCGHADPTMILKIYDEVSKTRQMNEVKKLEKTFNQDSKKIESGSK